MATLAFDTAVDGGLVNPGTSLTWSHTVTGSNPILVVGVFGDTVSGDATGVKITGVTYNSVAMTLVAKKAEGNGSVPSSQRWLYSFLLIGPATGAHNVVVSASSSIAIGGVSGSWTGAKQSSQPDNSTTNSATSATSITTSLTSGNDNCWDVVISKQGGGTSSAGTGSTQRVSSSSGIALYDSNAAIHPAGSDSMQVTVGVSSDWATVMLSIQPDVVTAFDTARSNVAHSGNVYSGDFVQGFTVTINGTDRTQTIFGDSESDFTITDILGNEATVLEAEARGFSITEGQVVKVYNGGVDVGVPYFVGNVLTLTPRSQRKTERVTYGFTARDFTWRLDQYAQITAVFEQVSVNTLVRRILATYTDGGFSGGYLPSSLGSIDTITFENESVVNAIQRIADQVSGGAEWTCDFDKTVSMWPITEENPRHAGNPVALTDTTSQRTPTYSVDLTQVRTRVICEGGGGATTSLVAAGATSIAVDEIGWYSSSGGTVRGGPVIASYTGVSASSGPGSLTGCSGITHDIPQGTQLYVRAQADNASAQTALAALFADGSTGIVTHTITDNRLSLAECVGRAASELTDISTAVRSYGYSIDDDVHLVSGRNISINVSKPATINTSLRAQQVVIRKRSRVVGSTIGLERVVTASPTRIELTDLLAGVA